LRFFVIPVTFLNQDLTFLYQETHKRLFLLFKHLQMEEQELIQRLRNGEDEEEFFESDSSEQPVSKLVTGKTEERIIRTIDALPSWQP
jgi:hypothetical protein